MKLSKSEKIELFKQDFPQAHQTIQLIRKKKLTYCGYPKLENICEAIEIIQNKNVAGIYVEAGCALGGSAILIAQCKPKTTPFAIYDVFEMIPPPSERDGNDAHTRYQEIASGKSQGLGGETYYGYLSNLQEIVVNNLESFSLNLVDNNITLIKGLFQDTLNFQKQEKIAFAHIDCDWYDSVKVCIDRITPQMSRGALIVFDDYSSYSGCKVAVDQLIATGHFQVVKLERSITLSKI